MKKIRMMMAAALGVLVSCGSVKSGEEVVAASRDSKVVVAYVTSWSEVMPSLRKSFTCSERNVSTSSSL